MAFSFNPMAARWNKLYKGTPAELAMEDAVASLGIPYRTQFPGFLYGFRFFPDFFLPTLQLVIEVDDSSHTRLAKVIADGERTEALEDKLGCRVVRCSNREALTDPHGAVRRVLADVGYWPLPTNLPKIAACMPKPGKVSKNAQRAAKSAARRRRRGLA
jgi:hypothetical protein